ncbi:MAG: glutamate mutase L [Spirochaetota bacterium]
MAQMDEIIAIDIGSTRTKGALFRVDDNRMKVIDRQEEPTWSEGLEEGFFRVLEALHNRAATQPSLAYSSSAKGGLNICAVGIVPQLTLKMAKQTALSAGGKVTSHFAYKLTTADLKKIETENPDIILLTGGTDGGNEEYLLHNAALLSQLSWDGPILFAGNRSVSNKIGEILQRRELYHCENILPAIDSPNPGPARQAIRDIFLQRLCGGKGLNQIVVKSGSAPVPTPSAIFDFLSLPTLRNGSLFGTAGQNGGFLLFDIGGATSDCYSLGVREEASDRILKGLPEPDPKRTVEGDLGIRVSAAATISAAESDGYLQRVLQLQEDQAEMLRVYAQKVSNRPESPPAEEDRPLAKICLDQALMRHAGRMRQAATSTGTVTVQAGKDLSAVSTVIGTGGFLARCSQPPQPLSPPLLDRDGWELLIPGTPEFWQDSDYLWPLLANAARIHPEAACKLAPAVLSRRSSTTSNIRSSYGA